MKRVLAIVASARNYSERFAARLFILFWPIANLYWVVCAVLGIAGKATGANSAVGEAFLVISVFMAFLVPLWALAVVATYYLATALAIASLRPIPILLCCIAWLEKEELIPVGHIQLKDVSMIFEGEFKWVYPLLYSALALLCSALIALTRRDLGADVR